MRISRKPISFIRVMLLAAFGALMFAPSVRATTIQNDDPQFTLHAPDQYLQLHDNGKFQFNDVNLYGFVSTNATYGVPDEIILIQRFPGEISQEVPDLSSSENKKIFADVDVSEAHVIKTRWGNYDISMGEGKASRNGFNFAIAFAMVPMKGHAVQILVLVRQDLGEEEAANVARDFLDGLSGPAEYAQGPGAGRGLNIEVVIGLLIAAAFAFGYFRRG